MVIPLSFNQPSDMKHKGSDFNGLKLARKSKTHSITPLQRGMAMSMVVLYKTRTCGVKAAV